MIVAQSGGFDHAAVVDRGPDHLIKRARRQIDRTVDRPDGTSIIDQRAQRATIDRQLQRSAKVEQGARSSSQCHGAAAGGDRAIVADLSGDQGHTMTTATQGRQAAPVDDGPEAAARKVVTTSEEIAGGDIQRGGDERPGFHLCGGREQHTIRVDQEHAPIGMDLPLNGRNIGTGNPVKGDGGCRRLEEVDRIVPADRKTAPVNDQLIAVLLHVQAVGAGIQRTASRDNGAAFRQGLGSSHGRKGKLPESNGAYCAAGKPATAQLDELDQIEHDNLEEKRGL